MNSRQEIFLSQSVDKYPTSWEELLLQAGIDESFDDVNFWKTLVTTSFSSELPLDSTGAEYRDAFKKIWTTMIPLIREGHAWIIEAARNGCDVYLANFLKSLSEDAAKVLMQQVTSLNDSPLHLAAGKGFHKTCEILLLNGADPNAVGNLLETPMHRAGYFNHPKVIRVLLKFHASPTHKRMDGEMPIHVAAAMGSEAAISQLIDHDVGQLTVEGREGRSVLCHAIMTSNVSLVKKLLDSGINIKRINTYSRYGSLHLAAIMNSPSIIQLLVSNGVDINMKDAGGYTALQRCALQRKLPLESVKMLIKLGIDIDAGSPTSLELLVDRGEFESKDYQEFIELLQKNGSRKQQEVAAINTLKQ